MSVFPFGSDSYVALTNVFHLYFNCTLHHFGGRDHHICFYDVFSLIMNQVTGTQKVFHKFTFLRDCHCSFQGNNSKEKKHCKNTKMTDGTFDDSPFVFALYTPLLRILNVLSLLDAYYLIMENTERESKSWGSLWLGNTHLKPMQYLIFILVDVRTSRLE